MNSGVRTGGSIFLSNKGTKDSPYLKIMDGTSSTLFEASSGEYYL
jgi:hypothetical protein